MPLHHGNFESAVLGLSAAYAAIRAREQNPGVGGGEVEWEPPSSFERKTTKYWVEPRDVMRLKLAVARHLPVLVYNGGGGGGEMRTNPGEEGSSVTAIPSLPPPPPQMLVVRKRRREPKPPSPPPPPPPEETAA